MTYAVKKASVLTATDCINFSYLGVNTAWRVCDVLSKWTILIYLLLYHYIVRFCRTSFIC
ncbi:hypothetical protein THF1C08_50073 [Vibrio jasicida]|uniref:Uncharacterized protein n=1 Tax=Vibrio jasicida TaxID=766224 RepID=A0AAU9QXQ6_9VIBR|nr:hypothetical protein THF1C08_50073 [Vibrio jasicida]CAH1601861.1 hypothetical protein THF1A12_50275 [Vibrio jasicida]